MTLTRWVRSTLTALAVAIASTGCDLPDCYEFGYEYCCLNGLAVVGCEEFPPFFPFPGGGEVPQPNPPPAPPPPPPIFTDPTGQLEEIIRSGGTPIEDIQSVSGIIGDAIEFMIPNNPSYAYPEDFGGVCPEPMVMVSGAALAPFFGGSRQGKLCVQTVAVEPSVDLLRRLDSAGAGAAEEMREIRRILEEELARILGPLVVVCKVLENRISLCIPNNGSISFSPFRTLIPILGFCPVSTDVSRTDACVARALQTPDTCFSISCVEALNALSPSGCFLALLPVFGTTPSTLICELIRSRNHFYRSPRNPAESVLICSTDDSPLCSAAFVEQVALSDVRTQAPFVLTGPPTNIAAPPLRTPRPIDFSTVTFLGQPSLKLGPLELFLNDIVNASNPILVSPDPARAVGVNGRCFTNFALEDHLLEGEATACIQEVQVGGRIEVRSVVEGRGVDTRFALVNEIVGPGALGSAQKMLRQSVQTALGQFQF